MEYIHHYNSPLGGITLACENGALIGLWFDDQKYFADTLGTEYEERNLTVFEETDIFFVYINVIAPKVSLEIEHEKPPKNIFQNREYEKRNRVYTLIIA